MPEYISLTELVRSHHMENPSYVIQIWKRSENTLAFLDLWERENNMDYNANAYATCSSGICDDEDFGGLCLM